MKALYHKKFTILLAILGTLLLAQPQVAETETGAVFLAVVTSLQQIVTMLVLSRDRLPRILSLVFGFPAVIAIFSSLGLPVGVREPIVLWAHGLAVIFFAITVALILRFVLRNQVTIDNVIGALVAYLMIGVAMGQLYVVLEDRNPHSFRASSEISRALENPNTRAARLTYYSFVTLTTSGYDDIIPDAPLTRTLAWMEAVAGQFYLAVLVAGLIGMRVNQSGLTRQYGTS